MDALDAASVGSIGAASVGFGAGIGATKVLDVVVTALKVDGVEDFRLNLLAGAGNATVVASVGVESEGF